MKVDPASSKIEKCRENENQLVENKDREEIWFFLGRKLLLFHCFTIELNFVVLFVQTIKVHGECSVSRKHSLVATGWMMLLLAAPWSCKWINQMIRL